MDESFRQWADGPAVTLSLGVTAGRGTASARVTSKKAPCKGDLKKRQVQWPFLSPLAVTEDESA